MRDAGNLVVNKNSDQLARFCHCAHCGGMLSVGCVIHGQLRDAVNSLLLDKQKLLGALASVAERTSVPLGYDYANANTDTKSAELKAEIRLGREVQHLSSCLCDRWRLKTD